VRLWALFIPVSVQRTFPDLARRLPIANSRAGVSAIGSDKWILSEVMSPEVATAGWREVRTILTFKLGDAPWQRPLDDNLV
jgi:hypothetical protein